LRSLCSGIVPTPRGEGETLESGILKMDACVKENEGKCETAAQQKEEQSNIPMDFIGNQPTSLNVEVVLKENTCLSALSPRRFASMRSTSKMNGENRTGLKKA